MSINRLPYFLFALSAGLFVLLHSRALYIAPSFDDWLAMNVWRDTAREVGSFQAISKAFWVTTGDFWRPLPLYAFALVRGESAVIPQALKLVGLIGMSVLVVRAALVLNLSRMTAWLTGSAFLLHQCMVLGQEIDRWGDLICDGAILWMFVLSLLFENRRLKRVTYLLLTGILTFVSILGKEAGIIAFFIPAAVALLWSRDSAHRRDHLLAGALSIGAIVLYMLVRFQLGLGLGSNDPYYSMKFGMNVLNNLMMIVFALFTPVNTVDIVMGGIGIRVIGGIATGLILGWFLWGLWRFRAKLWRVSALLIGLFTIVQGPSLLMPLTNESNFDRSLPYGLVLAAFVIAESWGVASKRSRVMMNSILIVVLLFHTSATYAKVTQVVRVSDQSRDFRDQVQRMMPAPADREIVFVAERTYHGYSSWAIPLWMALPGDAGLGMRSRYHNPDYKSCIVIIDSANSESNHLRDFDFYLDRNNCLKDRTGASVTIQPPDPYLNRGDAVK